MSTQSLVRLGVIGSGSIAKAHATRIAKIPNAELTAFADVEKDRAESLARTHHARAYNNYQQMLDKESLDAVLLCTPHFMRCQPIEDVASRGLALFCEKPPAFTFEDARHCLQAINKAGIINTCGLMYRWAEIADRLKELIAGRPVSICQITGCWPLIRQVRGKNRGWLLLQEKSGGPMVEQGIHLLDAARYVLDDDVIKVQSFGSNLLEPKAEDLTIHDTIMTNLCFAKGTVGTHVHSWSHSRWIFGICLIGKDFELKWDIFQNRLTGTMCDVELTYQAKDDPYDNEFAGFVKAVAVNDQRLLRCTYADACKSFAATMASVNSARTGQIEIVDC